MRPPTPCLAPGCPTYAAETGYCSKHYKARNRTPAQDQQRRLYASSWWRAKRARIPKRDPFCRDPSGCTAASTQVDHITPRSAGGTDDDDNLRGLCHRHHSAKTMREVQRRGAR